MSREEGRAVEKNRCFSRLSQKICGLWKRLFENYAYLWLFAMVVAIVVCFRNGIVADPEHPAEGLFFMDFHDVGMDHFNSIFVTADRTPYTQHHITYPPLAAMIYYLFFLFLDKGTAEVFLEKYPDVSPFSLRTNTSQMVPYMLYVILCAVLITCLLQKNLKVSPRKKTAATIGIFLSVGFLSILDRGNNVLLVAVLLLYYVFYYNSDRKFLSETALIALALATGIKLYPVIFGVLLIRRHKIAQGFRAVGYILLSLVLPFFFFEGFEAMKLWAERLFPSEKVIPIHPGALNFVSAIRNIEVAYGVDVPDTLVKIFPLVFIGFGLIFAITFKKDYKALIFATFAIVGFAGVTFKYFLFLSILPLAYLFTRCEGVRDRIWGILLILVNLPMCMPTPEYLEDAKFCLPDLITGIFVLIVMGFLLIDGAIDFVGYVRNKRWKYLLRTEKKLAQMSDVPQWEE